MDLAQKPTRKPDYRLEMVDGEAMLYHPAGTQIMYFNESAALLWQLCDGQRSAEEIIALLQAAYPESAEDIKADVTATLQEFLNHDCIDLG